MNAKFKQVVSLLDIYKTYLILIVFFCLIFLFHSLAVSKKDSTVANPDNFKDTNVIISNNTDYKIPLGSNIGDSYRLSFRLKALSLGSDQIDSSENENSVVGTDQTISNSKITVSLISKMGERKKISEVTAINSDKYQDEEISFVTDEACESIILSKSNIADTNLIFMKDEVLSRLYAKNQIELQQLRPNILGETDLKAFITRETPSQTIPVAKISTGSNLYGEVFRTDSEYLGGISLKIKVHGCGGHGSYHLGLYEVEKNGDNFTIDPTKLADYEFHSYDPSAYLNQYGEWEFPITSKLTKDRYYFIGLDSSMSQTDLRNYIEILGSNNSISSDLFTVKNTSGLILEKLSSKIYFKLYKAKYAQASGERILSGARIEDLGEGKSYYKYVTQGQPSDLLDVDQSTTLIKFTHTVLGVVQENGYFVYKFNFVDNAKKIFVESEPIGGNYYRSLLYYSFDGISWSQINFENQSTENSINQATINVDQNNVKRMFLKIAFNPSDKGKLEGLFGVKSLKVYAELSK